jgi:hypothetical protein
MSLSVVSSCAWFIVLGIDLPMSLSCAVGIYCHGRVSELGCHPLQLLQAARYSLLTSSYLICHCTYVMAMVHTTDIHTVGAHRHVVLFAEHYTGLIGVVSAHY